MVGGIFTTKQKNKLTITASYIFFQYGSSYWVTAQERDKMIDSACSYYENMK